MHVIQIEKQNLPADLPFRIISRTIGSGAYAFIRKACPLNDYKPVIAVKFIHKRHAYDLGRVKPKQIATEVALHQHAGKHNNIVQFLASGEDAVWTWIAMEYAGGGDLFDKIEADEGVGQDIAHLYFTQLVSAVGYAHSRGVAHRDIKPENIFLSDEGDLKLGDFGLAVLYMYKGEKKTCQTVCGSPPYMAPEVVPKGGFTGQKTLPYEGNLVDIWSCGVVLFVLLAGNTPWDEPTTLSEEFLAYTANDFLEDELWTQIPHEVLSLLKGMLRVDPFQRFTLEDVRRHPWFTRRNPHLHPSGRAANPIVLATQMLEKLHINFGADPTAMSQRRSTQRSRDMDSMDTSYEADPLTRLALTQPEPPIAEQELDWERPRAAANMGISASQPVAGHHLSNNTATQAALGRLVAEPALSQFSQTPAVPLSVTQQAKKFGDIVPQHSITHFWTFMDFHLLLPLLSEALARLNIQAPPIAQSALEGREHQVFLQIRTRDERNCMLAGTIVVERIDEEIWEVRFLKAKGDPLEWRKLFKKVSILCRDGLVRPD